MLSPHTGFLRASHLKCSYHWSAPFMCSYAILFFPQQLLGKMTMPAISQNLSPAETHDTAQNHTTIHLTGVKASFPFRQKRSQKLLSFKWDQEPVCSVDYFSLYQCFLSNTYSNDLLKKQGYLTLFGSSGCLQSPYLQFICCKTFESGINNKYYCHASLFFA